MEDKIILIFLVAFVFGIVGNEIGHRTKKVDRQLYAKLAVGVFSGFASALLCMILNTVIISLSIYLVPLVSVSYGYLMANGKAFNKVQ